MKKILTVFNKLLHPPQWVRLLVSPIVFSVLAYSLITEQKSSALAYLIYGMSAYCLIVIILTLPGLIRGVKEAVLYQINCTKFGSKYVNDISFRGNVSIYRGMFVNFLYVIFRFVVGVCYASVWSISIAVYHLMLGLLRLSLIISYRHRNQIDEQACYCRTAWSLFFLNIPMGGMILLMVLTDSGYSYPEYIIYLSAMYTFYSMIISVINLAKFRRVGSVVLSAAKILNFVAAMMSVLALQTAMIAQFSAEDDSYRKMMNAITGGVVWSVVILTAFYMLYQNKKTKVEVKSDEPGRK